MMKIERLIWNNSVTNQCAPMVRYLLNDADFYSIGTMSTTDKLKTFADLGPMQYEANPEGQLHPRSPGHWDTNQEQHLWWTWLTEAQMQQFVDIGAVPRFKDRVAWGQCAPPPQVLQSS
eukprot:6463520-Amphidinium_carterae.1